MAIWITSIGITQRYIARPMLALQHSASRIAGGDLDTYVDTSGSGEIGRLARHLDRMRGALQQLVEALRDNKAKVEEYSRTLEQKPFLSAEVEEYRKRLRTILRREEKSMPGPRPLSPAWEASWTPMDHWSPVPSMFIRWIW